MILSRWIKPSRIFSEIDNDNKYDVGLTQINGDPIYFAKYLFNSNNETRSIYDWLSAGSYIGSQYIGFFKLESIKNFFNGSHLIDKFSHFNTNTFFTFDSNDVFNESDLPIQVVNIENPEITGAVTVEKNKFKYFIPPDYPIYFEDGTTKEHVSNYGEIDIVASNISVFGILCDGPLNLFNRTTRDNENMINYCDKNVNIINLILSKMKEHAIVNNIELLITRDVLHSSLKTKISEYYVNKINKLLHKNDKARKLTTDRKVVELISRNMDNHDILLKILKQYRTITNDTSELKNCNIMHHILKYVDINYIGSLLFIAKSLNNKLHANAMKLIFGEIKNKQEHPSKKMRVGGGKNEETVFDIYQYKYFKYKKKYSQLKNE